jgi:hypothetical protein
MSDAFMLGYGIPINSTRFQQDGARPQSLQRRIPLFFEETVLTNRYSALFEKDFFMATDITGLNPCDYFLWRVLEG